MSTAGDDTRRVNTSLVNAGVEMLPYPDCTEGMAWGLFFPDFFCGWMEGGGRKEGTLQQISPSSVWEAVERSTGPEGKVFVQELQ